MQLSKYQQAILQAVKNRIEIPVNENLNGILVEALAGTGKSFILVQTVLKLSSYTLINHEVEGDARPVGL